MRFLFCLCLALTCSSVRADWVQIPEPELRHPLVPRCRPARQPQPVQRDVYERVPVYQLYRFWTADGCSWYENVLVGYEFRLVRPGRVHILEEVR